MRPAQVIVSTTAILLSLTAASAQQGPASDSENVFVDVAGTPIQVPLALAAQACELDEAAVQQAAFSRIESSGLDETTVQELLAATAPGDMVGSTGGTDAAAADPTSTPAPGSEPASAATAEAAAASTPAPGGEPASTDLTASDEMAGVLEDAETTAGDTTATPDGSMTAAQGLDSKANEQMLALAVCQVEVARAGELGITGSDAGTTTGADPSGSGN